VRQGVRFLLGKVYNLLKTLTAISQPCQIWPWDDFFHEAVLHLNPLDTKDDNYLEVITASNEQAHLRSLQNFIN